jgi:hypothetical protein
MRRIMKQIGKSFGRLYSVEYYSKYMVEEAGIMPAVYRC